ncbi:MAG: glycoside hydrolase family 16 protein [Gemmatimonadota bacterium]|nr:glycoside hydrolase family 16 protein [Gemmatimonadota bacterium]MDE2679438.1 glycoside hydrolase family 16 protein [Gemmatimonadota bacterium]MYA43148.1 glycoside hydrolase family 16 protein [Gemmatimonadota bacterium]MYE94550.1 glycoside hydrolase family 16 protein [Gemmatimonadota bacterium]MYJ12425.1 glycoside hydrolase family 16 protein [Gemmatimonadota bacterium]
MNTNRRRLCNRPTVHPVTLWPTGPRNRATTRRSGFVALLALSLLALPLPGCDSFDGEADPVWTLVWSDEFDGPAGQLPNSSNWTFDIGTDWGNNQLEYDTDRPENVSLDGNGNLAITAREESYMGSAYTSGRIKTQGLFEQAYGRFEARIQLPTGQGIWPAFWMLGNDIGTVGWPECGEIDIMEYRGQEPSIILGTIHGPGYSGGGGVGNRYALTGDRFDTGFHEFAIEWTESGIVWFVDGQRYHAVDPGDPDGRWVFDHPFFILLNVAVGGGFVGPPNESTTFPQTMLVDWVRVYRNE